MLNKSKLIALLEFSTHALMGSISEPLTLRTFSPALPPPPCEKLVETETDFSSYLSFYLLASTTLLIWLFQV